MTLSVSGRFAGAGGVPGAQLAAAGSWQSFVFKVSAATPRRLFCGAGLGLCFYLAKVLLDRAAVGLVVAGGPSQRGMCAFISRAPNFSPQPFGHGLRTFLRPLFSQLPNMARATVAASMYFSQWGQTSPPWGFFVVTISSVNSIAHNIFCA